MGFNGEQRFLVNLGMKDRQKLTVYDYLKSKGRRQLSNLFVHNIEEAAAAEEAEIDYIVAAHDLPQFGINASLKDVKRIREVAPSCFMQSAGPIPPSTKMEWRPNRLNPRKEAGGRMKPSIREDSTHGPNWRKRREQIPLDHKALSTQAKGGKFQMGGSTNKFCKNLTSEVDCKGASCHWNYSESTCQ